VDQAERRLQAIDLECIRGQRRLFQHVSFVVNPGELLWVQGANGSGKTSLLRLLCGLMRPEAGRVSWCGHEVGKVREQFHADLLYFGHAAAIKDDLTALENLRFSLVQAGVRADPISARTALGEFGLGQRIDVMARALSQGQRRRVGLARLALARAKPLWILDEPLTALDREAAELVRGHLEEHLRRGGSIVLTSHQDVDFGTASVTRLRLDA
jgi:heme exporter protein A